MVGISNNDDGGNGNRNGDEDRQPHQREGQEEEQADENHDSDSDFEEIRTIDAYAKPILEFKEVELDGMHFEMERGESLRFIGLSALGAPILMTNYRLFSPSSRPELTIDVPLGLLDEVRFKEYTKLYLSCKDGRSYKLTLLDGESALRWMTWLHKAIEPLKEMENAFPLAHYIWAKVCSYLYLLY